MDIKETVSQTLKSGRFEGISVHVNASEDSRLQVQVELKASVDLPGDADKVVAQLLGFLLPGNSSVSVNSSPGT